jgi:ketosteroid isomerase-like protein
MSPAENVVREFWQRMATNDFSSVQAVLADDFVLEWPQSNERIRGPANFVRMNAEYPTHGRWTFDLRRFIAGETEVVTQVAITDGIQSAEAISFFTITEAGRISRLVEFWPEPFAAPENRRHLTEPMRPIATPLKLVPILESGRTLSTVNLEGPAPEVITATVQLYGRRGYQPPWTGYLALDGDQCVGSCGFAHPPRDGEVEIAYFCFPGHEGRGVATRMARELLRITREAAMQAGVDFIAHTLPTEGPSTSILRRLGFQHLGEIEHSEDGRVWKWRADAKVAGSVD